MTKRSNRPIKKQKKTVIDYTLEQFLAEAKRRAVVDRTLERMLKLMQKFEKLAILHDFRIAKLERKSKEKKT